MVRKSCDVMCPVLGRCGRYDLSSLITISALDRTVCHAVHHEALQRNKHRQNRDNENQCNRHHCADVGAECSVHFKKSFHELSPMMTPTVMSPGRTIGISTRLTS